MKPLSIVFVSSEAAPFSKTGGLADVSLSLPKAMSRLGHDMYLILPYYRQTKKSGFTPLKMPGGLEFFLGDKKYNFCIRRLEHEGVKIIFIEYDYFFDRDGIYSTASGDYPDNAVRFAFFSRAALAAALSLKLKPDVIHCNDWQTALIPFFIKTQYFLEPLKNSRLIFTIHNIAYQGIFGKGALYEAGISEEFFNPESLEFYGNINFMKAGVAYADSVSTVSGGYARQIITPEYGRGLDGFIRSRRIDVRGITNGVDYELWSPEKDPLIKSGYSIDDLAGKHECKEDLKKIAGLNSKKGILLGMVTRLVEDKGIDIIVALADFIVSSGSQLVILGLGNDEYNMKTSLLARNYPGDIFVKIGFDNALSHKIEAGADIFLMPSRHEPCGLNQLYSLRYGTIPVVTATGGLDDTIIDYNEYPEIGNGFKCPRFTVEDYRNSLLGAFSVYAEGKKWQRLMLRAMKCDFSWEASAREYERLYHKAE